MSPLSTPLALTTNRSVLPTQKTVRVAVIGAPNAGKSTLTNTLVGQLVRHMPGCLPAFRLDLRLTCVVRKVTAVSRKTNTTRVETLGAATFGDTQLVLHDTPGAHTCAVLAHGLRAVAAARSADVDI